MADVFGDLDLFSEFDKDREAKGSFIHYDVDEGNAKSRIIFEDYESDTDGDSADDELSISRDAGESLAANGKETIKQEFSEDGEIKEGIEDVAGVDAANESQAANCTSEEEKKVAWLNAQLYAEAVEEAKKDNASSYQLVYERNKYRRYARILDSTRCTPDEESPAVQLIFNNNSFARKYRQQIEQFIKGLLWEEFRAPKDPLSEVTVKPGNPSCVDINSSLPAEKRSEHMRQKHALIGNSQFHKQFLVDNLGWPFNIAEPTRCNVNWEIPLYGQVFNEVYADPSNKPAKPRSSKPKPSCWNCGEPNHSVADCIKPKNPAKIASNKREFMALQQEAHGQSSGPKFSGPSRYHKDPELASKHSRYSPGSISDKLREALGLRTDQLPQHIYKMRLYGYPPGWLAEAKQVHSGVTIFDKHGRVALITGECLEDGELDEEDAEAKQEYDVNKIIEYPGFTIPVPLGFQDEHTSFKLPPIQQHQLKKTLQSQTVDKSSSKKRKRKEPDEDEETVKKIKTDHDNSEAKEVVDAEEGEIDDTPTEVEGDAQELESDFVPPAPVPVTPQMQRSSSTISLSRDYGTPILATQRSLPDASKFGKDIEDHIPFENLPGATGTFEKMKDLLDLIRKKTKKQS